MQLSDQYPGYVVRDLYCLPVNSYRLYSSSPDPPLNLDCDWKSSPCDFPTSCLVSTFYPVLVPPSPSGASHISVMGPANNFEAPFYALFLPSRCGSKHPNAFIDSPPLLFPVLSFSRLPACIPVFTRPVDFSIWSKYLPPRL